MSAPKLHYYHFTCPKDAPFGWAKVVLGPGFLMAVSDYGHWSANWGPQTGDFRRYFAVPGGISAGYFCEKTGIGRDHFDAEATVAHVRKDILRRRREGHYTCELARKEWNLIKRMDENEIGWEGWLTETEIGDPFDDVIYDYPPRLRAFTENVLPELAKVIAAELAAEAMAAAS